MTVRIKEAETRLVRAFRAMAADARRDLVELAERFAATTRPRREGRRRKAASKA